MKTIIFKNKKYQVPTDWNEVTLRMQQSIKKYDNVVQNKFSTLSSYTQIPIQELKHCEVEDLPLDLVNAMSFINQPLPDKPILEFDFNNSHYWVGQNLVEMEFQDYISLDNVIKESTGSTWEILPTIIAILAKKKKANGIFETLDDYDVMQRAEEFKDLPIAIANQLSLFFSTSVSNYTNLIQSFSNPELTKQVIANQLDLQGNMLKELGGKGLLTKCVAGILRIYLKYIRRALDKHFTSIQQ